ncbi:hypothetical protein MKX01_032184 [Papaver californicum]|nr:hypothetical protein MKX01_015559 [Papaver californicum]KAI3981249.1 hypothetical protein MKX01_032184 [Papaver californicum]
MDASNLTHFKPEIKKDKVLDFITSQNSLQQSRTLCVIDDDEKKDESFLRVFKLILSSLLMVELNQKEVSEEPISQLQNRVKKNQECEEPMGKGSIEFYDSFIVVEKKEDQIEISCKDSAKEEMLNSERCSSSSSRIEANQDEVFQVQDVITGDEHIILVVETTQDDFIKTKSMSASGSTCSNGMAKIGSSHIVNGNGCAREGVLGSIALGKRRSGICSENIRQQVEKCSRRKFAETNLKKDVFSVFIEARNVFGQKKSDGSKRSYSREEMEALRG